MWFKVPITATIEGLVIEGLKVVIAYLILRSRRPVGESGRVGDALFQAMCAKGSKCNGRCAIDATDCPEHGGRRVDVRCRYIRCKERST